MDTFSACFRFVQAEICRASRQFREAHLAVVAGKAEKSRGSLATTPEENASVFADAFSQLYGREASFDPSVLDDLPQRPVAVVLTTYHRRTTRFSWRRASCTLLLRAHQACMHGCGRLSCRRATDLAS